MGRNNMNRLLDRIIKERNGHYCHTLELDSAYSYECIIEQIVSEYKDDFSRNDIIRFFETIEVIYYVKNEDDADMLTDDDKSDFEEELLNVDYKQIIIDCY